MFKHNLGQEGVNKHQVQTCSKNKLSITSDYQGKKSCKNIFTRRAIAEKKSGQMTYSCQYINRAAQKEAAFLLSSGLIVISGNCQVWVRLVLVVVWGSNHNIAVPNDGGSLF